MRQLGVVGFVRIGRYDVANAGSGVGSLALNVVGLRAVWECRSSLEVALMVRPCG